MWDDDTLLTALGTALDSHDTMVEPSAEELAHLASMVDAQFVMVEELGASLVEDANAVPSAEELASLAAVVEQKFPEVLPVAQPAKVAKSPRRSLASITANRKFRQVTAGLVAAVVMGSSGVAAAATGAVPVPEQVRDVAREVTHRALPFRLPDVRPFEPKNEKIKRAEELRRNPDLRRNDVNRPEMPPVPGQLPTTVAPNIVPQPREETTTTKVPESSTTLAPRTTLPSTTATPTTTIVQPSPTTTIAPPRESTTTTTKKPTTTTTKPPTNYPTTTTTHPPSNTTTTQPCYVSGTYTTCPTN